MKSIKLKNYPKSLPDTLEVRDFEIEGKRYARVIMEASTQNDHLVISAQAYEMTKDGTFKVAPNGYPSRSNRTDHSVSLSDLGRTINMEDGWAEDYQPVDLLNLPAGIKLVTSKPSGIADYQTRQYDKKALLGYVYREGHLNIIARTKVKDLLQVLNTSDARSGFAFRSRK